MSNIKDKIIEEVKKIFDPEIPVNIYELGLIYKIDVDEKNKVNVDMTLTSPNCPVAESLPNEVKESIKKVEGVSDVNLNLVWESHHAMGVPIKINIEVLTMANLIVTIIAEKSNGNLCNNSCKRWIK